MRKILNILKRIVNDDYLFSIVAKMSGVILGMVYSIGYNRFLGSELRGEAAIINNYVGLIGVFWGFGIYQAYPYFKKNKGIGITDFVNNISSMFLLYEIIAIVVACLVPMELKYKVVLIVIPLSIYARQINYVIMIEYPKRRNVTGLLLNFIDIFVIFGLLFFVKPTYSLMIFVLVFEMILNVILSMFNLRYSPLQIRINVNWLWTFAKYGFVPMLTTLLMTINYKIDVIMLEKNVATSAIGIYALGVSLAERVWLIPDAVKDIMVSKLAKGKDANETAKVLRCGLFAAVICTVAVIIFGKPFFIIMYGKEFEGSYLITVIMLLGIIGMIFYKMVYSYNVINGHKNINLVFLSIAAVINVIGNYIFIPVGGIYAAAWVSVASYLVCGLLFLMYFHKQTGIKYIDILIVKKSDLNQMKKKILR